MHQADFPWTPFGSHFVSEAKILCHRARHSLKTRQRLRGDAEIKWKRRARESLWLGLDESEHFVPFRLILEHDFAEQTNGWHAVVEQLVVEFF